MSSYEMASSLYPNDRLLISKFWSGARFPTIFHGQRDIYFRLPAINKFKNNDVVAFNDPRLSDLSANSKPLIISRIIGIPGDTILVWDKNLYVNRKFVSAPSNARREYRVITDGSKIPNEFIVRYHIEPPDEIADIGIWDVFLDTVAYQALSSYPNIKQIRPMKMYAGDSSLGYWPFSSFFPWNRDQVGPLIVPYEGLTVDIDLNTIDHYRNIIENHENQSLLVDYRGIQINGTQVHTYTFSKNYYFVLDDNRDNPRDSRIVGYIPEDHLLGRINRILWSPTNRSFVKTVE